MNEKFWHSASLSYLPFFSVMLQKLIPAQSFLKLWFPALWCVSSHTLCTAFHFGFHTVVDFILVLTHMEREHLDLKRAFHFEIQVNFCLGSWNNNKVFWTHWIFFSSDFQFAPLRCFFYNPVWSGENCRNVLTPVSWSGLCKLTVMEIRE